MSANPQTSQPNEDDEPGPSVIDESPRRQVGDQVYVSVPGPPVVVRVPEQRRRGNG